MDEVWHLASAGLTMALAIVLLVSSYFFLEAQSARHSLTTASDAFALKRSQVALYQAGGF